MKKNVLFIVISCVIVVGLLLSLTFINKSKEKVDVSYEKYETLEKEDAKVGAKKLNISEDEYSKRVDEVSNLKTEATNVSSIEEVYVNQPYLGKNNAPVEIVVFGDYKCSHCFNYESTVFPELYEKYIKTGIVKYYFVNMQMQKSDSIIAGIVGEEIFRQDPEQFWNYHSAAFNAFSKEFNNEEILRIVKNSTKNIDIQAIEDVLNGDYQEQFDQVYRDYLLGQTVGVQGTPTIVINGIQGSANMEVIDAIVEAFYDEETGEVRSLEEAKAIIDGENE